MNNSHMDEANQAVFDRAFESGFDAGKNLDIEGETITGLKALRAVHMGAFIAGMATKLADMVGEESAIFALHQAMRVVSVHCEHKRETEKAN